MRTAGLVAGVAAVTVALAAATFSAGVESASDSASDDPVSVVAETSVEPESVSVAVAQAATVGGPSLVFASWNVCKVSCAAPAPSWDIRRDRVARVIAESGADVIGVQEATNNATNFAKTQADDVAQLAAPSGFVTPVVANDDNECRRPRDSAGQLAGPSPCDNTAMLLYRASSVQPVQPPVGSSAGIVMAGSIAPGLDPLSGRRSVAWAYLQGANGTGPFLAVSLHTDSEKSPTAEASRVVLAQGLGPWTDAWNAAHGLPGIPVVLMADLNSYDKRQPQGAQAVLRSSGWTDAYEAPTKRNNQYSTINYNPLLPLDEQGFPVKPYVFRTSKKNPVLNATRIDYVFGRNVVPLDYEVVMRVGADGAFIPDYQASDHQMVRATMSIG